MQLKRFRVAAGIAIALFAAIANAAEPMKPTPSSPQAKVYIIEPLDGAIVNETFTIKFGLSGMGVAPAGVNQSNTGHHHLLIDQETLPPPGVPMGDQVIHFGGGQTETTVTLTKGQHTLQLILGDMMHIPHDPMVVSKKITVTVE
jgi:hypothetical protein